MSGNDNNKTYNLDNKDYSEVTITGDGNCFYHCLSMHIEHDENNYNYQRQLIYKYVKKNQILLKEFFEHFDGETEQDFENRYNSFIDDINRDGNFAGDFEISAASLILNKEIIIYRKNVNGYEYINNFSSNNNNSDKIYLIFKNNNHFNIIMNNNINIHPNKIDKKSEKSLHKKIENKIKKLNINDVKNYKKGNFFSYKYVPYFRKGL